MEKRGNKWLIWQLIFLLFVFSYFNQFLFRYNVPPGGDAVNHNLVVNNILSGNYSQIFQYHSFWHLITAFFTIVFHTRSISVMAWLGPMLLVTMGASLYWFNNRYFGPIAGIASLVLIGFFSLQPLQTLYDGGFPNVLAAGTFLPIVFILLERIYSQPKKLLPILLLLFSLILLAYTHHLTTIYTLAITGAFIFLMTLVTLRQRKAPVTTIISVLLACFFAFWSLAWWFLKSPYGGSVKSLATQFIHADNRFPFIHLIGKLDNPNAIWPVSVYPNGIGEAIVYLGVGGFVVCVILILLGRVSEQWRIRLLLVLWAGILFLASRMPSLGFPVRLARDLAIPLALLGGVFVHTIITYIKHRKLPMFLAYGFVIVCLTLGWLSFNERIQRILAPNPLISHLKADSQAAKYITKNLPLSSRIATFQDDIYLDDFTPLHKITRIEHDIEVKKLVDATTAVTVLEAYDYIYLERRYDREESWKNNDGIIDTYNNAPYLLPVAKFEQPEKHVYIYKIYPSLAKAMIHHQQ